jgi:putative transposase
VLVDTLGLLLRVLVLPANLSDAAGGLELVAEAAPLLGRLRKLWVDSAYAGSFEDWVATVLGWEVEIVRRLAEHTGFAVQPQRWIVERSLAWLSRHRRLAKDYEHLAECSEAHIYLASIGLLLKRLAPACG